MFTLFRDLVGHSNSRCSVARPTPTLLAMHLLARSQGVATLRSAFHNERFIEQEVKEIHDWLKPYYAPKKTMLR